MTGITFQQSKEPVFALTDGLAPYGRVPLVLAGDSGDLHFVALRAVTSVSDEVAVERDKGLVRIGGGAEEQEDSSGRSGSCVDLLGRFTLDPHIQVAGYDLGQFDTVPPQALLLANVSVLGKEDNQAPTGYVTHYKRRQLFPSQANAGDRIYSHLLELAPAQDGEPFANIDDIGALILTDNGVLAGILVALSGAFGYAVPLHLLLEEWDASEHGQGKIATADDLAEHNRRARRMNVSAEWGRRGAKQPADEPVFGLAVKLADAIKAQNGAPLVLCSGCPLTDELQEEIFAIGSQQVAWGDSIFFQADRLLNWEKLGFDPESPCAQVILDDGFTIGSMYSAAELVGESTKRYLLTFGEN